MENPRVVERPSTGYSRSPTTYRAGFGLGQISVRERVGVRGKRVSERLHRVRSCMAQLTHTR